MMKKLLFFSLIVCNITSMGSEYCRANPNHRFRDRRIYEERKKLFIATAKERLENKKNLDEPVIAGEKTTLLCYFAGTDSSLFKKLLEAGATPSRSLVAHLTLYPYPCGFECVQELLLKYKATIDIDATETCPEGTALQLICNVSREFCLHEHFIRIKFTRLLLSNGAHPNLYSHLHKTPLHNLFTEKINSITADQKKEITLYRKHFIHTLIYYGAHLRTIKDDPRLPSALVKDRQDPDLIDLARYTEQKYYFRILLLYGKQKEPNIFQTLPKDLLKLIADRV